MATRGLLAALLLLAPPAAAQTGFKPPPWEPKRPELVRWRSVKGLEGRFSFGAAVGTPQSELTSGSGRVSASGTATLTRQPLDPWFPAEVTFTGPIRGTATFQQQVALVGGTTREAGGCAGTLTGQEDGQSYLTVKLDLDEGTFQWDMAGVVEGCQDPKLSVAGQEAPAEAATAGFTAIAREPSRIPAGRLGLRASGPAMIVGGQLLPLVGEGTVTLTLGDAPGEERLELSGCSHLGPGASSTVTARGEPEGGRYRFWTEPAGTLSIRAQEDVATLSCEAAGTTELHVEYSGGGGQKASQPGSCARVDLVNFGFPIPRLGLLDVEGQPRSPPRTVSVKAHPAGEVASLLHFEAADPGIVTAAFLGDQLTLQGTAVGTTTVQARTRCNEATGPAVQVEVAICDDEVLKEMDRRADEAVRRANRIAQEMADVLNDPEVTRAQKELPATAAKAGWATVKAIASAVGAAGKYAGKAASGAEGAAQTAAEKAAERGEMAISVIDAADKLEKLASLDTSGVAKAMLKTLLKSQIAQNAAAATGAAEKLAKAVDANVKLARDVGILGSALDRLNELKPTFEKAMFEAERRRKLLERCHAGGDAPPPGKGGGSGGSGAGGKGQPPSRQGSGGTGAGPAGGSGEGAGGGGSGATGGSGGSGTGSGTGGSGSGTGGTGTGGGTGGGDETKTGGTGGSGGIPWPEPAGRCTIFGPAPGGASTVEAGMAGTRGAASDMAKSLAGLQQRLPELTQAAEGLMAAADLDEPARGARFAELRPAIAGVKSAALAVGEEGRGYLRSAEGCDSVLEQAMAEARQRWESFLEEVSQ